MTQRIPITVISGYLGAGKTTILNKALAGAGGRRLAVLVNDFGAVNIDADLIDWADDKIIALNNGCVCCSIGDDLGEALSALTAQPVPPEAVLLETSGISEPARVGRLAGHWPGFALDMLIVAADAETVQDRARDKFVGRLVQSQLRSAQIVALTKTDRVDADAKDRVTGWLRQQNGDADIVETVMGAFPPDHLFNAQPARPEREPTAPVSEEEHAPHFHSVRWLPTGAIDTERLRHCLQRLPASVARVKGILIDAEGDGLLVQGVGRHVSMSRTARPESPCLVLIAAGDGFDLAAAQEMLDRHVTTPPAGGGHRRN